MSPTGGIASGVAVQNGMESGTTGFSQGAALQGNRISRGKLRALQSTAKTVCSGLDRRREKLQTTVRLASAVALNHAGYMAQSWKESTYAVGETRVGGCSNIVRLVLYIRPFDGDYPVQWAESARNGGGGKRLRVGFGQDRVHEPTYHRDNAGGRRCVVVPTQRAGGLDSAWSFNCGYCSFSLVPDRQVRVG